MLQAIVSALFISSAAAFKPDEKTLQELNDLELTEKQIKKVMLIQDIQTDLQQRVQGLSERAIGGITRMVTNVLEISDDVSALEQVLGLGPISKQLSGDLDVDVDIKINSASLAGVDLVYGVQS
ncbi:MAG: hypothetical protein MHM6MM_004299 [Cercozoa sp. M6MM]